MMAQLMLKNKMKFIFNTRWKGQKDEQQINHEAKTPQSSDEIINSEKIKSEQSKSFISVKQNEESLSEKEEEFTEG